MLSQIHLSDASSWAFVIYIFREDIERKGKIEVTYIRSALCIT